MNETKALIDPENEASTQMEEAMKEAEEHKLRFEPGQIIEAKVVLVRDEAAFVDLGGKSDFAIPVTELSTVPVTSAREVVKEGDLIKVMVTKANDDEKILLSKRRAEEEEIWNDLKEVFQNRKVVSGLVTGVVKGGLNVNLNGVHAFMPASHAVLGRTAELDNLVGQSLAVNILELDVEKRRVLTSRKSILEEERRKIEEEFFQNIKEGERRKGKVTRIANFGAFVDLGSGIEGLIHISELSWNRVKKVGDLLKEGDEVETVVTKVDATNKKLSLSLKQLGEHPWDQAVKNFVENTVYPGTVVRLESFGAFIRLAPEVEGLAHISQLADRRVNNPEEVLTIGQEVQAKILKIDRGSRKVSLSLKQVTTDQEKQQLDEFLGQQEDQPFVQNLGDFLKIKKKSLV
ncbi:MAG: 30S ribosomal protein S1 [Firmicutes bacterium]|nr:30S ribosomal protein S1 [Bacillota bacterium]